MEMEVLLYASDTPLISFNQTMINVDLSAAAKFYAIKTSNDLIPLFRLDMVRAFFFFFFFKPFLCTFQLFKYTVLHCSLFLNLLLPHAYNNHSPNLVWSNVYLGLCCQYIVVKTRIMNNGKYQICQSLNIKEKCQFKWFLNLLGGCFSIMVLEYSCHAQCGVLPLVTN